MVLDMEYREKGWLEHGPGGPIFLLLHQSCLVRNNNTHHHRPGIVSKKALASWGNWSGYHGMCHFFIIITFRYMHITPFISFSEIPGWSIWRFCSFGFYILLANFTLWAFIPFFPQGTVQPFASLENPMPGPVYGMDEREKRWKVLSMVGRDDELSWTPSPVATQTLWETTY